MTKKAKIGSIEYVSNAYEIRRAGSEFSLGTIERDDYDDSWIFIPNDQDGFSADELEDIAKKMRDGK